MLCLLLITSENLIIVVTLVLRVSKWIFIQICSTGDWFYINFLMTPRTTHNERHSYRWNYEGMKFYLENLNVFKGTCHLQFLFSVIIHKNQLLFYIRGSRIECRVEENNKSGQFGRYWRRDLWPFPYQPLSSRKATTVAVFGATRWFLWG